MKITTARISTAWARWRPENFGYGGFLLALAIAITGAVVFSLLHWPLAWMIGPIVFCAIAALARLPVRGPGAIRPPALMVVGVTLGASFSPSLLAAIPGYSVTILLLLAQLLVSVVVCYSFFRFVVRLDSPTALFSAIPGGLNEMIILGEQHGADSRAITLIQTSRIIFVIALMPLLIRLDRPFDMGSAVNVAHTSWAPQDMLVLAACGLAGVVIGRLTRLPAAYLLGPLIVSAIVHATGLTTSTVPTAVTNGAQIILGLVLGCRFVGMRVRAIARLLLMSLAAVAILLLFAWLAARLAALLTGNDFLAMLIVYAPGGVAEMGLAALALGVAPSVVAIHHMIRILAVLMLIRPILRMLVRQPG